MLPGAVELAERVFELPVRLGSPLDIAGWSDQVNSPQYATAVGLLRFTLRQRNAPGRLWDAANHSTVSGLQDAPRRVWGNTTGEADGESATSTPEFAGGASDAQDGHLTAGDLPLISGTTVRVEPKKRLAADIGPPPWSESDSFWQRLFSKIRQIIGFEEA